MTDETYTSRRERRHATERAIAESPPASDVGEVAPFAPVAPPEALQAAEGSGPWAPVSLPVIVTPTATPRPGDELDSVFPAPASGQEPAEEDAPEPEPEKLSRRQQREQTPKATRKELRSQRLAKRRWWRPILDVLIVIVCAALVAVALKSVALRTFDVPSESMNPTLITNDRILVEMVTPHFDAYKRGDVVVFRDTDDWLNDGSQDDGDVNALQLLGILPESTGYIVKRVLAVPGETIEGLADGTLLVNGKKLDDTYSPRVAQSPFIWTLSDGEYWMMGDNRGNSADSRTHGPVDGSEFVGRVAFTFFPFDRAGAVS